MGRLGLSELLVILVVALLLFGAGRVADIGKGLGEGIKNFKKGLRDDDEPPKLSDLEKAKKEAAETKALPTSTDKPS